MTNAINESKRYVCKIFGHNWNYLINSKESKDISVRICSYCKLSQRANKSKIIDPNKEWVDLITKEDILKKGYPQNITKIVKDE